MSGFGVTQEGYVVDGGPLAQIGPNVAPEVWQEFSGQLPKDDEDYLLHKFITRSYTNERGSEKLLDFFEKLKTLYWNWDGQRDEIRKRAFENLTGRILEHITQHEDDPDIKWVLEPDITGDFISTIKKSSPFAIFGWESLEEMIEKGTLGRTGRRSERQQEEYRRDEASSSGPNNRGGYVFDDQFYNPNEDPPSTESERLADKVFDIALSELLYDDLDEKYIPVLATREKFNEILDKIEMTLELRATIDLKKVFWAYYQRLVRRVYPENPDPTRTFTDEQIKVYYRSMTDGMKPSNEITKLFVNFIADASKCIATVKERDDLIRKVVTNVLNATVLFMKEISIYRSELTGSKLIGGLHRELAEIMPLDSFLYAKTVNEFIRDLGNTGPTVIDRCIGVLAL